MSSQGWGCSSMVEGLPSMCEALDLIPSTTKAKKRIFFLEERIGRKEGQAEEKEEEKRGKERRKNKG